MRLALLGTAPTQLSSPWLGHLSTRANEHTASKKQPTKKSPSRFIARQGTAVIALLVGTGGLSTAEYIAERNHHGYPFDRFELGAVNPTALSRSLDASSAAETLEHVKAVFEPSITELASVFEVSRQTIYNWQAGLPMAAENLQRLERLARAGDIINSGGLAQNFRVLRRPITDGKNLFELTRMGLDPEASARALVTAITEEAAQRKRLKARLANRRKKPLDIDDIGASHLNEEL